MQKCKFGFFFLDLTFVAPLGISGSQVVEFGGREGLVAIHLVGTKWEKGVILRKAKWEQTLNHHHSITLQESEFATF